MAELTKAEAARRNGAQSHGPVTPEGKAKSAQNATRHGLNSAVVVLANECPEEYEELLSDYIRRFQPSGKAELDLIHEIAANRWRLRRLVRMEAAVFDQHMERVLDSAEENTSPAQLEALAFEELAGNSKSLRMLARYESRLRRGYESAIRELQTLQVARHQAALHMPPPTEPVLQNEPKRDAAVCLPAVPQLIPPARTPDLCPPLRPMDGNRQPQERP